jgi:hypothetical protein
MPEIMNKSEEPKVAEAEVESFRNYRVDGLACTIDIPAPQAARDG